MIEQQRSVPDLLRNSLSPVLRHSNELQHLLQPKERCAEAHKYCVVTQHPFDSCCQFPGNCTAKLPMPIDRAVSCNIATFSNSCLILSVNTACACIVQSMLVLQAAYLVGSWQPSQAAGNRYHPSLHSCAC